MKESDHRIRQIRLSGVIAVLMLAFALDAAQANAAETGMKGSRPNVVVFLGDDQSRSDHTAYGHPTVPTPTTEAFAEQSLVFDKAFTGQAICAPSRSMLYTGLYPIRNGCFINHSKIRPGVKTLPAILGELGYTVILAGKSHIKPPEQFPWAKRFSPVKKEGMPRNGIPIEKVGAFLADPGPQPFCLVIASEFPHPPCPETTPYSTNDVVLPPFVEKSESALRAAARYYANVAAKEAEFAEVLALLDKHELANDCLVLYADDHGLHRGKFTAFDSGLNVAFMVRWPGRIQPGRTDALTSFADFVPTLMELAGGTPEGLDGKSLLPVFEKGSGPHHEYVYGVTVNQGIIARHVFPQRSVHDGRYHYIHNFNTAEGLERERAQGKEINYFLERGASQHPDLPEEMLFDTQTDPHEMTNLAQRPELAEIKQRLKAELFRWMKEQHDYLSEAGPVPFLETGGRFSLDQADDRYALPPERVGTLRGMRIDPHQSTAPAPIEISRGGDIVRRVWELEQPRIRRKAAAYLDAEPRTVTADRCQRSPGGPHDFYSEGDYWWPDPDNPGGPFIRRDGETYPGLFVAHREAMVRFSDIIGTLASAYVLTQDDQYVKQAVTHLKAWFVDPETRMNPSLLYGQAIAGRSTGRSIGIIDTIHLTEVARGAKRIGTSPAFSAEDQAAVKAWFRAYLTWINSHPYGLKEKVHGNNHGVCWSMQAAAFADLVGDEEVLAWVRNQFKTVYLGEMMDANGGFPAELGRTKPYGYSLFVIDAMAGVAQIASTADDDLWQYRLPDGRGMRRGLDFIVPFIQDKSSWPYGEDVLYFDEWPVRHPCLVFAAQALEKPEYLDLWEPLDADPTTFEVLRNLPLRHPLLWLDRSAEAP